MSRKVFTAGEVLAAADVNSFLMDQTVMSFAGTAARGSAIPSPVEGMTSFLEDLDQVEIYSNSAWRIPYGMTPIVTESFTSITSLIISNCFSAKFENYFIQISAVNGNNTRLQLRTGTTTSTSSYAGKLVSGNGSSAFSANRSTSFFEAYGLDVSAYLFRPFVANVTSFSAISNQDNNPGLDTGRHSVSTSYESLVLSYAATTSGTIRIYGIRN
jgi:hypothetical protein